MDSKSAKHDFQACGCSFSQLIREGCRETVEYLQQHVDPTTLLEWRWESVCDKYEECFYPGLGNPLFELAGLVFPEPQLEFLHLLLEALADDCRESGRVPVGFFLGALEEGRISGIGTHEELRESNEAYREICDSQLERKEA